MAVIATLSKGYDLDYIWKQVDPSLAKEPAGYYIRAAEAGGEPPGHWWGRAAQALGLRGLVEREPYDLLFGQRQAPDDTPLGRPPSTTRKTADVYARLLSTEPHATAERKRELRLQATRQTRQSPLFFDLTLSLSKSISIFHASLGENARLAHQAGDTSGEQYWSALVAEVDDMIMHAVRTAFEYFQREAGYTRTGSHNTRVHNREAGQWHEADLAVAHWLQHTSRDGDMQLHVHSQIAQMTRLLALAQLPGVTIQVVLAIAHAGLLGGFSLTEHAAYVEAAVHGMVFEDPEIIASLLTRFDTLRNEALRASESLAFIERTGEKWKATGARAATQETTEEPA